MKNSKIDDFRKMSLAELENRQNDLKKERLIEIAKASGEGKKNSLKIRALRKQNAQVLTIINQKILDKTI